MDVVEHRAGTLIEQIGIEPIGAQQRNTMLPLLALGDHALELARESHLLLGKVLLRLQTVRRVGRQPK